MNNGTRGLNFQMSRLLAILLPAYMFQMSFNVYACQFYWHAYWPLVLVTSFVPLGWLVFRKKASALAANLVQLSVIVWFNWQNCMVGKNAYTGESAFVGGLGAIYAISISAGGGILVGILAYYFTRKNGRG